jgi:hypothetical protein
MREPAEAVIRGTLACSGKISIGTEFVALSIERHHTNADLVDRNRPCPSTAPFTCHYGVFDRRIDTMLSSAGCYRTTKCAATRITAGLRRCCRDLGKPLKISIKGAIIALKRKVALAL